MKVTVFTDTDTKTNDFYAAALPLFQRQPVVANLAWGLAAAYKNGQLAQAIVLSDEENPRFAALQTEADRLLIVVGEGPIDQTVRNALTPYLRRAGGLIAPADLASGLRAVFTAPPVSDVQMWQYRLDALTELTYAAKSVVMPDISHRPLLARWLENFTHDIAETGGSPDFLARADAKIAQRSLRFLLVDGKPVAMAGYGRVQGGVACVNCVYTPPEQRGRGYSTAVVGLLVAELLQSNDCCCLYADVANPASNRVYEKLGFYRVGQSREISWK